jgi:hypothetical protein
MVLAFLTVALALAAMATERPYQPADAWFVNVLNGRASAATGYAKTLCVKACTSTSKPTGQVIQPALPFDPLDFRKHYMSIVNPWSIKASSGGGGEAYAPCPAGNYPATVVGFFDVGTQANNYQGEEKNAVQIVILYELD